MSLPTPNLDDRRFQDIVDEAKRLIPKHCPEWTDHNVSDPGVALIELFAWMTDLTLYRLNQVPDRLYVKFLDLLGISLYPAASARTDILFWLSGPQPESVRVPAGTQVGTVRTEQDDSVVFMTDEERLIVAPHLSACLTESRGAFEDHLSDITVVGEEFPVFRTVTPGEAVYFGFAESLRGNVVRLRFRASVASAGVDPRRPPWVWEVLAQGRWQRCRVLSDETLALNRNGAITLIVPPAHDSMVVGPTRAHWIRCRLLEAEPDQPIFRASPRVKSLEVASLGGVVAAHNGQPAGRESLGRSDGTPGQRIRVRRTPVLPRRQGETIRVISNSGPADWSEVADFAGSGPDDRHFTWDSPTGEISFGPGMRELDGSVRQYGAVPPVDAEFVATGYRYGGGNRGNVGARTITWLKSSLPFIGRVENLDPARGGIDGESVENAKLRGPQSVRTNNRAVTAADYERLTLQAAVEVARARCLPPAGDGGPVRVLVVPRSSASPDQLTLEELNLAPEVTARVSSYLDRRRMLTTTVEIRPPTYVGVSVQAHLAGLPGAESASLRSRALGAVYGYVNPVSGGPGGQGWPFGRALNVGDLFALLSGLEGVAGVDEVVLEIRDPNTGATLGTRQRIELPDDSLFLSFDHAISVR
ncbi:MAG: putative baseplate assembly protein [Actinomycetota bacterium]|nr:putative baseplate assembly protein [Actinomycetota bacterium]